MTLLRQIIGFQVGDSVWVRVSIPPEDAPGVIIAKYGRFCVVKAGLTSYPRNVHVAVPTNELRPRSDE